jgi:hypothetical protein
MEFTKHLDIIINWGTANNVKGGLLETLQAMQAEVKSLTADEQVSFRTVMTGFQQMLAPV